MIILVQISLFFSKISIIEQNICQIFFFFSKIFYKIGFPKHILTKFTDITCKHKTRSFTFILTQEKASTCTILYLNCILNNKYNWNTSTTQTYQVRKPHKETCKHCRLWLASWTWFAPLHICSRLILWRSHQGEVITHQHPSFA